MRRILLCVVVLAVSLASRAAEEKIRGVLEKTVKAGACAQITDALNETYFINKTDEAEKLIANFIGKNQRVVVAGTVETKEGDSAYFFNLKSVEPYTPKLPPVPAAAVPETPAPAPPGESKAPAPPGEGKALTPPAPEKKDDKK